MRPVAIMVGAECPSRPASRCVGFHLNVLAFLQTGSRKLKRVPSLRARTLHILKSTSLLTPLKWCLHCFRLFAVSGSQGTRRGSSGLVFTRPPARQGDILPESRRRARDYLGLHILHTTISKPTVWHIYSCIYVLSPTVRRHDGLREIPPCYIRSRFEQIVSQLD